MHNIQVQGKPFLQKAKDEAELQSQVQELLTKGLIRPSRSNYPCTNFIVRNHSEQKQGKSKMVIDYIPKNIKLEEEDIYKATFITPNEPFKWLIISFGLKNALYNFSDEWMNY